ncbi:ABC transporter substrate-binding protein [Xenorhabdus taiwanensis]
MDENKSVHTTTWLRAIDLAREFLLPPQVTLKLFDDNADARRASETAQQIVAWSPNAIVGHFASAAAEAAAPLYAQHNLPLFLPAATAKHLTSYPTTWRLCDNDEDYACWLLPLLTSQGQDTVAIDHDGSVHGKSVAHQLSAAIKQATRPKPQHAATTFFAGSFRYALKRAISWAHCSPKEARLILTDDAFSAELVPALLANGIDLGSRQIYVAAITPQPTGQITSTLASAWHQRWGGAPGCYFWETMAALQVACQYPDFPAQTLFGMLNFDAQREIHPASFSLWQATYSGLQIVQAPKVII